MCKRVHHYPLNGLQSEWLRNHSMNSSPVQHSTFPHLTQPHSFLSFEYFFLTPCGHMSKLFHIFSVPWTIGSSTIKKNQRAVGRSCWEWVEKISGCKVIFINFWLQIKRPASVVYVCMRTQYPPFGILHSPTKRARQCGGNCAFAGLCVRAGR